MAATGRWISFGVTLVARGLRVRKTPTAIAATAPTATTIVRIGRLAWRGGSLDNTAAALGASGGSEIALSLPGPADGAAEGTSAVIVFAGATTSDATAFSSLTKG